MSQPKRYSLVASYYSSDAKMEAFEDGEFVRHADYAALQAENERLRIAGSDLYSLTKILIYCLNDKEKDNPALDAWLAAKGVQS
jgi:hypothetical protein